MSSKKSPIIKIGLIVAGALAIFLAIVLLFVAGIDSIEILGKYRWKEIGGHDIEEVWEDNVIDDVKVDIYQTFGFGGKVGLDVSITSEAIEDLDEDRAEWLTDYISDMEEEFAEYRWSLDDGKLVIASEDDEDPEKQKYELGFNALEVGKKSERIVYKRVGFLYPSMILRLLAALSGFVGIVLIAVGLIAFLRSGLKSGSVPASAATSPASFEGRESVTCCASCGGLISEGDKFCESCGAPIAASGVAEAVPEIPSYEKVEEEINVVCEPIERVDPVAVVEAHMAASHPVEEVEPIVVEEVTPITSAETAPTGGSRLRTTFKGDGAAERGADVSSGASAPISDDSAFTTAGDL